MSLQQFQVSKIFFYSSNFLSKNVLFLVMCILLFKTQLFLNIKKVLENVEIYFHLFETKCFYETIAQLFSLENFLMYFCILCSIYECSPQEKKPENHHTGPISNEYKDDTLANQQSFYKQWLILLQSFSVYPIFRVNSFNG